MGWFKEGPHPEGLAQVGMHVQVDTHGAERHHRRRADDVPQHHRQAPPPLPLRRLAQQRHEAHLQYGRRESCSAGAATAATRAAWLSHRAADVGLSILSPQQSHVARRGTCLYLDCLPPGARTRRSLAAEDGRRIQNSALLAAWHIGRSACCAPRGSGRRAGTRLLK